MTHHKKSQGSARTAIFFFSAACIAAGSVLALYNFKSADQGPARTASVVRNDTGTMLVPDGSGSCNKFTLQNDSGKGTYEGTVPCDSSRPRDSRGGLPPVLRGMQDSLRRQQ